MRPPQLSEIKALRHAARVYLAQSRHFATRGHRAFAFTLLQWAANARRASMQQTQQRELFQ